MSGWRSLAFSGALLCGLVGCEEDAPQADTAPDTGEFIPSLPDADMADWFIARGRYAEALPIVQRVVEGHRSEEADELPFSLMSLGMLHDALGQPRLALPPLAEAWERYQNVGADLATLGACADALGLACHGAGEFDDAERALLAAVDYRQRASPDDPEPWVSASKMHLGRLYLTTARYEEAGGLLAAVLATAPDDAAVAARARQLGSYHHTLGAYARAAELFGQALTAAERAFGGESEQAAAVVGDLGLAQLRGGQLGEARANLERSRALITASPDAAEDLLKVSAENLATFYLFVGEPEKALPLLGDPEDAVGLNNLGSALQMTGQLEEAGSCFERARALAAAELGVHHPLRVQVLQNLACARWDLGDREGALAAARDAGSAAALLLEHLLEFGSEAQRLEFRRTSDPLSLLCSFGASPDRIADMLHRTKGVVLDSLIAPGDRSDKWLSPPRGAVLADACYYRRYLGGGRWEGRYGAVVGDSGHWRWVELGTEKRLRTLLAELRAHISAAAEGGESGALLSMRAVLSGLHEFCVQPLGEVGPRLLFSPDGDLRFVPFAALLDGETFLCEQLEAFTVVPSSRGGADAAGTAGESWALCSVGDYSGEPPADLDVDLRARLAALGDLPGVAEERAGLVAVKPFQSLPGAKAELLGALRENGAPEVLHFSCHGVFLGEGGGAPSARTCLVLAGKQPLFPAEIAALPLGGTRLVTLSACDTGLGVNMAGEGVLGLQRGFLMAGADHILMTLWAVGDRELPAFMAAFYRNLLDAADPSTALWRVQAQALRTHARAGDLARAVWIAGGFSMLSQGNVGQENLELPRPSP